MGIKREINYIRKRIRDLKIIALDLNHKDDAQIILDICEEIEFSLKIMQNDGKIPHEGERRLQWKS